MTIPTARSSIAADQRPVVFGVPDWSPGPQNEIVERLVGALRDQGRDARILVTQAGSVDPTNNPTVPGGRTDIPFAVLPGGADDAWGHCWEALIRYIEERAPCTYVMVHDWCHNVVAARLSDRVRLIGLVQSDGGLELNQALRLGQYWDAIVAVNDVIEFVLARRASYLCSRLVTIPPTAPAEYGQLLDAIDQRAAQRRFVRVRKDLEPPPGRVDGVDVLLGNREADARYVNEQLPWPDRHRSSGERGVRRLRRSDRWDTVALEDHRVLVAVPSGQISGVDTISTHLVRGLRRRGIDTAAFGRAASNGPLGLALAADIPTEVPRATDGMTWPERWRAMAEQLIEQGPCVYLPNYDYEHSGVSAVLPARVKVVPIAHSDDPAHYDHVRRIGEVSNAIVGVSDTIVEHIAGLAPSWIPRLHTIHYGVDLAPTRAAAGHSDDPLRIVYVGRLVEPQKRVGDLVRIAQRLADDNVGFELTIIGDGPRRAALELACRTPALQQSVRFLGKLPNDRVLRVLRESDALLLVSAFEGLSVGMLEAMASQVVPVVSATRSGCPDVIRHGENGLVAPVGNIQAFADHLSHLARDARFRGQLATAARATVIEQGLLIETMVDRYVEVLREAVAEPFIRPRGEVLAPARLRAHIGRRQQARRVARTLVNKGGFRVRDGLPQRANAAAAGRSNHELL